MQQDSNIIISDTSCLIILDKIDEIELLRKMGKKVFVTPIILKEIEKDATKGGHAFQDIQGDVYEMLLSEIATAGKN